MSFYIKQLGDWTRALHESFQDRLNGDMEQPLEVYVRGPYGAPTQAVDKYSRVFLISGGIGATPFASICKQIHHLHEEHDAHLHPRHEPIADDATEARIQQAVQSIYDVDMDIITPGPSNVPQPQITARRSHHMGYVTDMLRVTTCSGPIIFDPKQSQKDDEVAPHRDSGDSQDESLSTINGAGFRNKLRSVLKKPATLSSSAKAERQKKSHLGDPVGTALLVLHSSMNTFGLALLCVARMAVSICGSIFDSGFVDLHAPSPTGRWVALAYAVLSTPLALLSGVTVLLELWVHSNASFASARRLLEFIMFFPLSVALTVIEFRRWAINDPGSAVLVFVQYVLAQSVTFGLIVSRMWRAVGRRGLLDDGHLSLRPVGLPHADFVWVMADDASDAWLRREMADVTLGDAVTVRRYITRGSNRQSLSEQVQVGAADAEEGRRLSMALDEATHSGRPDWLNLLSAAARRTRSDGVVGIFFCGPKKMGDQVQACARKIEMWSNLKDAYLRSVSVQTLMKDIGLTEESVAARLRDFGCRVRFVYHEENFS